MPPDILLFIAIAFLAMWLMTGRTRKKQKEALSFRANLAPGQEVMTGSGLFGTIVAVDGDIITLETSPGVTTRWLRPAIARLADPTPVDEEDDEYEDDDETADGVPLDEHDDLADEEYEDDDEDEDDDGTVVVDDEDVVVASGSSATDGVEVPDDASSLTERDEDDRPRR